MNDNSSCKEMKIHHVNNIRPLKENYLRMKRIGNIMQQVVCPENLRLAYWKAQRGKSNSEEVRVFASCLDKNLLSIRQQLLSNYFVYGSYHHFTIYEPKERIISAASFAQRVVHHALMNICHPVFERRQLFHSYACRKNKGTFSALQQAASFHKKYNWYLKLDVRKYFDNINHTVLKEKLRCLFKDFKLLNEFDKIIDSYSVSENKGLPIGNLTSQYFANFYLSYADHYIKEKLHIPGYVRYMDDMLLFHNNGKQLQLAGLHLQTYLTNELDLELKPFIQNTQKHGLPFLGFIIHNNNICLNKNSRSRFSKKLTAYLTQLEKGTLDSRSFSQQVLALYGFISHASWKGFSEKVLIKYELNRHKLKPCVSWRQLEQQCAELPCVVPQQQQSRQSQQQPRVSGVLAAQQWDDGVPLLLNRLLNLPCKENRTG